MLSRPTAVSSPEEAPSGKVVAVPRVTNAQLKRLREQRDRLRRRLVEVDREIRRRERAIGKKAGRRIEARRRDDDIWFWLGMLGLVGWSVAIPTIAGVALGLWLERVAPASFSWVLTMLVVGLALGLFNAWMWVSRESRGGDDEQGAGDAALQEEQR